MIPKCARYLFLLVAVALLSVSPVSASTRYKPGGGDSGVDVLPTAMMVRDGIAVVTHDGTNWSATDELSAEALVAVTDEVQTVEVGGSSFVLLGTVDATSDLEATIVSSLAATPRVTVSAPSFSVDTHPAPARDEYHLKKTITTSRGEKKDIFKTLVVEKRSGETGEEFQRRSERELSDAMDAGWTSTP